MSLSSAAGPSVAPAKRACDSCHRRKVKCIPVGEDASPCRNCVSAGLECTFYNKVQKKGPKGSRAKVLSEIRETQKFISPRIPVADETSRSQSPAGPLNRTPGLLSQGLVKTCLEFYFTSLYPMHPILNDKCMARVITTMDSGIEEYCLVAGVCAFVLFQPKSVLPPPLQSLADVDQSNGSSYARLLLDEAIRVRRGSDWSDNPSLMTVYISYFIFLCQHSLDKQEVAWVHLRESITVALVLGMHKEETYQSEAGERNIYSICKRKIFWELYIWERIFALRLHRPLSFSATISLPIPQEEADATIVYGFMELLKLFIAVDDKFYGYWNNENSEIQPQWLDETIHTIANMVPAHVEFLPTSTIDTYITRQWLRVNLWKLQTRHSRDHNRAVRFKALVDICQELVDQVRTYNRVSLELHGLDLAEKIYDIALSLFSCSEMAQFGLQYAWRECLQHLLGFLSSLPSAQARLVPNLQAKLSLSFNISSNIYMPPHSPSSHHNSPITMQQTYMAYPPPGLQPLPQTISYGHPHPQHQINGAGQTTVYQPGSIPAVSSSEQHHPGTQASRMDYYYHGMNEQ